MPEPAPPTIETLAHDLAELRETVDELANVLAPVASGVAIARSPRVRAAINRERERLRAAQARQLAEQRAAREEAAA